MRFCYDLSKIQVLTSWFSSVDKRLNLIKVRFTVADAALLNMGFFNYADDKGMTPQIQDMHNLTFQIDGTLLNKRRITQFAVKTLKLTDFYFVNS